MKNEILTRMIEELETSNCVVPKSYKYYPYHDVLTVIKALKDNDIVKVTPNHIRLINRTNLSKKLEMVKNYYL